MHTSYPSGAGAMGLTQAAHAHCYAPSLQCTLVDAGNLALRCIVLCIRSILTCISLCCRIGYHEELVGFITARVCLLHECNSTDRVLMNLNSAYLDGQRVLYILTLGVLESARQQGIGSALLRLILEEVHI